MSDLEFQRWEIRIDPEIRLEHSVDGWVGGNVALGATQFGNQGVSDPWKAALLVGSITSGVDVVSGAAFKLNPSRIDVTLVRAVKTGNPR